MTNFSNIAVEVKDFGMYTFAPGTGFWTLDQLIKLFSTVALQNFWHVTIGIYMYVCFATSTSRSQVHQFVLLVGSMSQLLNLSSTSSEGVVPTSGRYGSVPRRFFGCPYLSFETLADLPVW